MSLQSGWRLSSIGDVCEIILGQSPPSSTYNEQGIGLPFYQGSGEFGELYPTVEKWCTKPKKIAESGDILLSVRAPVGPTNICQEKSAIGRGLAAIRYPFPHEHKFLFYFFRSIENSLSQTGTGSTFSAITKSEVHNLPFPLPPLAEQRRIVAKIEELFSKLDAGVEALKKVSARGGSASGGKGLLARYQQSVLKHAFEGKLTAEWRKSQISNSKSQITRMAAEPAEEYKAEAHIPYPRRVESSTTSHIESASSLLARIREERKKVLGKKYKESPPIDTSDLPALQKGWAWVRLSELFDWINGEGLTKKKMVRGEFPVYGGHGITGTHNNYLTHKESIIIGRVGAHCGNVALAPARSWITDNAIYSSWSSSSTNLRFYSMLLSKMKLNELSGGSGQPYVSQAILNSLVVPLVPVAEQAEIVSEIDRRFSAADQTEKTVDESLRQAERLRQSILKRAFEGKLVPQDPTDPPASELLERIRAEREIRKTVKKPLKRLARES